MSAPNGNVTAWIAIIAALIVTVSVVAGDSSYTPVAVPMFFTFLGGLFVGRYIVPAQRLPSPSSSSATGSGPTNAYEDGEIG